MAVRLNRSCPGKGRARKGFTLIEVLVGLLILSVSFGGLIASFDVSKGFIYRSGKRLSASNLTRSVLNDFNNAVRSDTWGTGGSDLSPAGSPHPVTLPASFAALGYSGTYTVTDVDVNTDGEVDYRQVTLTLIYPD